MKPSNNKIIGRRAVLASMGITGIAAMSGALLYPRNGESSVLKSVYDPEDPLHAEDKLNRNLSIGSDHVFYRYAANLPERTVTEKLREGLSVKDFGAVGDGIADDTAAIQAAANSLSRGGILFLPTGTYKISDTLHFPQGTIIQGAGLHSVIIQMTDPTQFAFNLFTPGTRYEYFSVSGFTLNAKYGITNRWNLGTDYVNETNPSRTVKIYDVKFNGTYDVNDPLAQSTIIPTREELESHGVGVHLVMVYGAEIRSCMFDFYGIGIENIGCTLSKFERNRFNRNARHIHDERVLWYNSSFGMGADNVYEQNDLLDATRVGGVTLWRSYGAELRHNYCEHLERGSSSVVRSAPELYLFYNTDACKFHMNHHNAYLSIQKQRPYIKMVFNGQHIGRASGNLIQFNTITAFNQVMDNFIEITTTKWDRRYPWHTQILYQELSPLFRAPCVLTGIQPELNTMEFDNLFPQMNLRGTQAELDLPFTQNELNQAWYLTSGENRNFRFRLYVNNSTLTNAFKLCFTAEGNPTTSGGNGRLFVTVRDQNDTIIYNDFAFTQVTTLTTRSVDLILPNPQSLQMVDVDLTNLSYSKVYRVSLESNQVAPGIS